MWGERAAEQWEKDQPSLPLCDHEDGWCLTDGEPCRPGNRCWGCRQ